MKKCYGYARTNKRLENYYTCNIIILPAFNSISNASSQMIKSGK